MKSSLFLFVALLIVQVAKAAAVDTFENEYFKIALPEGMMRDTASKAGGVSYRTENYSFMTFGENTRFENAADFINELHEKIAKDDPKAIMDFAVLEGFPVNRLRYRIKEGNNTFVFQFLAMDNGISEKLGPDGKVVFIETMSSDLNETEMNAVFDNAFSSLRFKTKTHRCNDFTLVAPNLCLLYYSSYSPALSMFYGYNFPNVRFNVYRGSDSYVDHSAYKSVDELTAAIKEKYKKDKTATVESILIGPYKASRFKHKFMFGEGKTKGYYWEYEYFVQLTDAKVIGVKFNTEEAMRAVYEQTLERILATMLPVKK